MLLLVLCTPTLIAQDIKAPRLHVLDNGLRVITVEDHSSPVVTTLWSAHVGDSAEPADFAGNSHYLEHLLLFRGTKKHPGNDQSLGPDGFTPGQSSCTLVGAGTSTEPAPRPSPYRWYGVTG
jgi:predicted Zn-dependent peptidase